MIKVEGYKLTKEDDELMKRFVKENVQAKKLFDLGLITRAKIGVNEEEFYWSFADDSLLTEVIEALNILYDKEEKEEFREC